MITVAEISAAIAQRLKENGYHVVPMDAEDGFQKPACCVEVFPTSSVLHNFYVEEDTFSVTVLYIPKDETQLELVKTAENLKNAFLYLPIEIAERSIDTEEISFSRDGDILIAEMEYIITQNPHEERTEEDMQYLNLR